jgi:hypothetical protein
MTKIIIDGANVASINGTKKRSVRRIEIAIGQLDSIADCVKAVLPSHWNKHKERILGDPAVLDKLVRENKIEFVNKDDDFFMINYCVTNNTYFLTNDKLRNHRSKNWWSPKHDEWATTHLLEYELIYETLILSEKSERTLNQASIDLHTQPTQIKMEVE